MCDYGIRICLSLELNYNLCECGTVVFLVKVSIELKFGWIWN